MNEACEDILTEWRSNGLAACLEGQDIFLPFHPAGRVVTWAYDDEPDLIKTTMDRVDWAVAKAMDISVQMLHAKRRGNDVAIPRFLAMYLISEYCPNRSLPEIGRHFHMDHTSIMHGIRRAKEMLEDDPDFHAAHEKAQQVLVGLTPLESTLSEWEK